MWSENVAVQSGAGFAHCSVGSIDADGTRNDCATSAWKISRKPKANASVSSQSSATRHGRDLRPLTSGASSAPVASRCAPR